MRPNFYNDNCMMRMPFLDDKCIDLTLTDIPYGAVNRASNGLRSLNKSKADIVTFDLTSFLSEVVRITRGSIYIFCGTEQVSAIRKFLSEAGMTTRLCIWEKTNPSPMNGQHVWLSSVECCVYGKFPKATFNYHCKSSVFRYPCGRNKIHPTQKPLELIKYIIEASSNEGDIVFDPCAGSCTTGVAALELNRRFIGCEMNKDYYSAAWRRLNDTYDKLHRQEYLTSAF